MLSIGKLGGAGGSPRSAGYYTASVAKGREDYYAGRGEAPGGWIGAGAEDLGLSGDVDAEGLGALMAGLDPGSGQELRRVGGAGAVSGFDLTFSMPKSVSVLYAAGGEEIAAAVRLGHDGAVAAALGYMEREACRSRRGKGGVERVAGEGFVGGAFVHRTSRAGDPQLHTHVVVGNLTRSADGRWRSLDGRALYHHAKTGGYVYQAELRARLSESIGVEWNEVCNGMADVRGMGRAVIEHFSQRRAEIVDALAERWSDSPRSAQAAALETRRPKDYSIEGGRLHEQWRARAAEHGLGPAELKELVGRCEERPAPDAAALRELEEQLAGPEGLTGQASSFDRRAVIQAFADAHRDGADVARIEVLSDRFLDSAHVVALEGPVAAGASGAIRRNDGRLVSVGELARYSTPELLECERGLVEGAQARKAEGAGTASADATGSALAARAFLSEEQVQMVRSLTGSGDGVQVVRAAAGTGKTTALEAAHQAWTASGYRVVGATLSARAACELRDTAGIDSTTVAQLKLDLARGWGFSDKSVVVLDEAGMVGTRDLDIVAGEAAKVGAKLVLVGDDRQLPEIDAGGAFRGLADRLGAIELREVRRQRDAADRAALTELRDGRPAEWLAAADERGRLVVARGAREQQERLVSDWWHDRDQPGREGEAGDAVMFAPTREAARELNERARGHMRAAGRLGGRELTAGERGFADGDRVLCLRNDRAVGVLNGHRGTVVGVEAESRSLRVEVDGVGERTLPASYLEAGNVEHGYAITVHKAQGMTVERSYVLGSEELYRELGYTALSRHRDSARFYINGGDVSAQLELELSGEEREAALDQITRALGRSRAQELALDVHERDQDLCVQPTVELAGRAGDLEELLASFPAAARSAERDASELARQARDIGDEQRRVADSRQERTELGRLDRHTRIELDARIARQERTLADARERYAERSQAIARAQAAGDVWLERYGVELAQLTVIETELEARRARALEDAVVRARHDPPGQVERALGPRPNSLLERERWDRAAVAIEGYRLRYGEAPEGERPDGDPARAHAWEHSQVELAALREPHETVEPPAEPEIGPER